MQPHLNAYMSSLRYISLSPCDLELRNLDDGSSPMVQDSMFLDRGGCNSWDNSWLFVPCERQAVFMQWKHFQNTEVSATVLATGFDTKQQRVRDLLVIRVLIDGHQVIEKTGTTCVHLFATCTRLA